MTDREVQAYAAATVVGSPSDTVQSYFGMRKISTGINPATGKMALLLNNKLILHNGTPDQGRWPGGFLTLPSAETARSDNEFLQTDRHKHLRKHNKVDTAPPNTASYRL